MQSFRSILPLLLVEKKGTCVLAYAVDVHTQPVRFAVAHGIDFEQGRDGKLS